MNRRIGAYVETCSDHVQNIGISQSLRTFEWLLLMVTWDNGLDALNIDEN